MCSNRCCSRSGRIEDQDPTCAICRDCWTWPHEARPSAWCWRMRSLIRNPTTNTFGNAWGPGASSPPKRRGIPNGAIRNQMYRAFPEKLYRQRTKVETIFSVVKRKLYSRAPGRSLAIQIRQALLLGLAYNLYRLRHPNPHEDVNRAINTCKSVSKQTTLTPFRMNTYEKIGGGEASY